MGAWLLLGLLTAGQAASAAESAAAEYASRLRELAATLKQPGDAATVLAWAADRDPECFYPVLPETLDSFGDPESRSAALSPFFELRRARAEALFKEAQQAASAGDVSLAYQSLWNAVRENPDHGAARKALGYQQVDGSWLTKFEAEKHRAGQVWHPDFGWLSQANVARYEAGERLYLGRWITAAKEAELRSDLSRGWQVQTEHYLVKTNHSLEAGVQLAARLERLHMAWRQLFVGYYATPRQMAEALVRKPLAAPGSGRRQVVLFRDRAEYLRELRSAASQIEITTGIYLGDKEVAYFYAADDPDVATQYHEATHQLFGESRPTAQGIGRDANFWVIEGIACYMESLREEAGAWRVGGLDAYRVQAARQRLVEDKFYLPVAQLTSLGMAEIQQNPQIRSIYSQSTGLTQFLLHAADGRYRAAAMQYLVAVYTGRDRDSTLQELTGVEYAELDRQYGRYLGDTSAQQ